MSVATTRRLFYWDKIMKYWNEIKKLEVIIIRDDLNDGETTPLLNGHEEDTAERRLNEQDTTTETRSSEQNTPEIQSSEQNTPETYSEQDTSETHSSEQNTSSERQKIYQKDRKKKQWNDVKKR